MNILFSSSTTFTCSANRTTTGRNASLHLLPEIDRLDLFFLAVLMHDTGKARRSGDHANQSVELAESVFARLEFDSEEREIVRRIIRNHLEMSVVMRRDIFAPETIRTFAEKIGSQSQLKMLTLITYADIKSVAPDALSPWKAENLWQLYMGASNFLDRSVDEVRYHVDADPGTPQSHRRARP